MPFSILTNQGIQIHPLDLQVLFSSANSIFISLTLSCFEQPQFVFRCPATPLDIQDYATQIKQYFAENYDSRAALKSPPHITLQPPFKWLDADVPLLEECLRTFASRRATVPIILDGFAAFPPRVIYINVLRTPELLELQTELMAAMETMLGITDPVSKTRPYAPHMTVAFKDLTKQNFKAAWTEIQQRYCSLSL